MKRGMVNRLWLQRFHLPLIDVFKKKVLMHEPISFLSISFFKECYERREKLLRLLQNFLLQHFLLLADHQQETFIVP